MPKGNKRYLSWMIIWFYIQDMTLRELGPCGKQFLTMELPNKEHLWTWGMSLGLYSKPYRQTGGVHENTTQGEMINLFKYHEDIEDSQRTRISKKFAGEVFDLLAKELRQKFPTSSKLPFDVCLGLPENRGTGRSLPKNICRILSDEHKWLQDGFEGVTKTRSGEIIKEVPHDERPAKVAGLYAIDKSKMPTPKFGFLIIDDVFETGSTIGALCKTLEKEFPGVPRYTIALTHLHATERMAK